MNDTLTRVCSHCDTILQRGTSAEVTHTICEPCFKILYPEIWRKRYEKCNCGSCVRCVA